MKFRLLALMLTLWMPCAGRAQQVQAQGSQEMTFAVVGYEILRKDAAVVLQGLTEVVDATVLMQQATKARAKISKLGTVRAQNGVRASAKEQAAELMVDASMGADGRTMAVTLMLSEVNKSVRTALTLADGQAVFLGTLDEPGKEVVKLVFIRAALSAGAPAPAVNAATELATRTFSARPDFLTSTRPPGSPPMKAVAILEAEGIDFPEGTSAVFIPSQSKLIVKNTPANLDRVQECLNKIFLRSRNITVGKLPPLPQPEGMPITMVLQSYEVSKKDALVAQAQDPKTDAKELLARLAPLAVRGLTKVVALPVMTGSSGHRSFASSGDLRLDLTPVLNAEQGRVSLTGTYMKGWPTAPRKVDIQTDLPFGGTTFVGLMDKEGGKDSVVILFLRVAAQPAGNAP